MQNYTIDELISFVNNELQAGNSVSKFEKSLGFGKDTLRKRLNRAGYKLNKDLKQFELLDNTQITHLNNDTNTIVIPEKKHKETHDNTKKDTNKTPNTKHNITHNNTTEDNNINFTAEEIQILKVLINNYKKSQCQTLKLDGKIVTRSFRSYQTVMNSFVQYCKENNLCQKTAFAEALLEYMK